MTPEQLMREACRLALESVTTGVGGPFGAVIVKDGNIVSRGQNRVLLTGDVTAHAEIEAIRSACAAMPLVADGQWPKPLVGCEMFASSEPCPMCWSSACWAGISTVYFAASLDTTEHLGFEDFNQYRQIANRERTIKMVRFHPELAEGALNAWANRRC
jgi:guanine deaminase